MKSLFKTFLIALAFLFFITPHGICEDSLIVDENGNVGIGVSTPGTPLHVFRTDGYNSAKPVLKIENGDGTATQGNALYVRGGSDSTNSYIANFVNYSSNSKLFIRGDGNVGIGTTTPSYKLDVNGTIRGSNVSPSDARWKTNINTIENSLDKVSKLRGVTYEWIDPSKGTGDQIGVIAQEVEEVFPEAVSTDNDGYKSVAYAKLVGPLIEAVKELKSENESLKQDNDDIKKQLAELKALVKSLQ